MYEESKRASSVSLLLVLLLLFGSVGRGVKLSREGEGIHRSLSLKGNPPACYQPRFLSARYGSEVGLPQTPPSCVAGPSSFGTPIFVRTKEGGARDVSSYCCAVPY